MDDLKTDSLVREHYEQHALPQERLARLEQMIRPPRRDLWRFVSLLATAACLVLAVMLVTVVAGRGQLPGVETLLELTGAGGTVFSLTLGGPFPFGEPIEQEIQEEHTLDPGVYTVLGQALSADAIDIAEPFFSGESALRV